MGLSDLTVFVVADDDRGDRIRDAIAVLIPTSSPLRLTSAPPELPGLMAASVWMKSS